MGRFRILNVLKIPFYRRRIDLAAVVEQDALLQLKLVGQQIIRGGPLLRNTR